MAALLVTVFEENKELRQGRLVRVSYVDMSLLSMLQALLSKSEKSELVAGRIHSVSMVVSAEGICLDAASDNNISIHVEFGRHHIFFNLRSPSHSVDADPQHRAADRRASCFDSTTIILYVSFSHSLHVKHLKKKTARPPTRRNLSDVSRNTDFFGVALTIYVPFILMHWSPCSVENVCLQHETR